MWVLPSSFTKNQYQQLLIHFWVLKAFMHSIDRWNDFYKNTRKSNINTHFRMLWTTTFLSAMFFFSLNCSNTLTNSLSFACTNYCHHHISRIPPYIWFSYDRNIKLKLYQKTRGITLFSDLQHKHFLIKINENKKILKVYCFMKTKIHPSGTIVLLPKLSHLKSWLPRRPESDQMWNYWEKFLA